MEGGLNCAKASRGATGLLLGNSWLFNEGAVLGAFALWQSSAFLNIVVEKVDRAVAGERVFCVIEAIAKREGRVDNVVEQITPEGSNAVRER